MRNLIKYYWPIIGLVFMILMTGYYIIMKMEPGKMIKKKTLLNNMLPRYALELQDVHYSNDNPNKGIKWELRADKIRFSKDRSLITFSNFHLIIHSKDNKQFDLRGKEGRYRKDENMLYLRGNLKAIYANNYKLLTDSMAFNEKTGQGESSDPVQIRSSFFHVDGVGMSLDLKKKRIIILSDVKSIIYKSH